MLKFSLPEATIVYHTRHYWPATLSANPEKFPPPSRVKCGYYYFWGISFAFSCLPFEIKFSKYNR